MLEYQAALMEAHTRFPHSPSRRRSFMESWRGLWAKGRFGRAKYRHEFGSGRRRGRRLEP